MLNARLVAVVAVVVSLFPFLAPAFSIAAQDGSTLPPGIQSVDVDGQSIDSVTVPVTNNPTPEISGRTELSVPSIDVIVGDAEPLRFTVELDERGRFRGTVPQALPDGQYPLAINDVPVGAFTVDSTAQVAADDAGTRRGRPLLDIARVVPYPVDFGDLLPGIGFLDGRFYTLDEEAARTAAANGSESADGVRQTRRALAEAGWLQRYENRLAIPSAENADVFDIQISSFVVEYATAENASAAFATLSGDDPAVESALVGDESALTVLTGVTPDTGAEYQAARLMFRVGPMLGMIVYADLLGQQPDLALLESVAQSVAGRGVVVAEQETVALGAMALQLDPSPATGRLMQRDLYDVRAGTLTSLYAEDEAMRESRVALFTGTTDAFSATTNGAFASEDQNRNERERSDEPTQAEDPAQSAAPTPTSVIAIEGDEPEPTPASEADSEPVDASSVIMIEGETPVPDTAATPPAASAETIEANPESDQGQTATEIFLTSALYAFPAQPDADTWLNSQRERLLADVAAGSSTVSEEPDAPTLGDASATFATQRATGEGEEVANGFRFYSRVGAIVAVLEIGSSSDLPLDNAASVMELQVECIEAEGCPGLASLAGRFVGGVERPPAESSSETTEQPQVEEPQQERPARAPRDRDRDRPQDAPPAQEAPVEEPTSIPFEEPTPIPIEEPTAPPVDEGTPPVDEGTPPVDEGTPPPVDEGTPPPAEEPTAPPGEEPTPPAEEPTPPAEEPTPVPGEEPTPVPGEEPTPPPAEEPTPPPSAEPTAIPTPGPDVNSEEPPEEDRDRRNDNDRGRDRDRRDDRD